MSQKTYYTLFELSDRSISKSLERNENVSSRQTESAYSEPCGRTLYIFLLDQQIRELNVNVQPSNIRAVM